MGHRNIVKTKYMICWEKKLEMDIENVVVERAHRTGKKNRNRSAYSCTLFILQEQDDHFKEL